MKQMDSVMANIMNQNDPIRTKWYELGFLEDLSDEISIRLAYGYEYMTISLIKDTDLKDERKYNALIDTHSFAVLRKIMKTNPPLDLDGCFIDEMLENFLYYLKADDCKVGFSLDTSCSKVNEENATRFVNEFVKLYYND